MDVVVLLKLVLLVTMFTIGANSQAVIEHKHYEKTVRGTLKWLKFSGKIVFPSHSKFEYYRKVRNGYCNRQDNQPLVIVRPRSSQDVSAAIKTCTILNITIR